MAVVWFSGAIKNRRVAIHHGSELTRRGPVMDTAKSGRQLRARTAKTGSDRWLFQTSSDADEHAEHSALSAISKRTQGEDYGQMDKSVIWRAVQSKGWNMPWPAWRKDPAYIRGLIWWLESQRNNMWLICNYKSKQKKVITFDWMRLSAEIL